MAALIPLSFISCGENDSDNEGEKKNSLFGYYADLSDVPYQGDFMEYTELILNEEASRSDFFNDDGSFIPRSYLKSDPLYNKYLGTVVYVKDNNTVIYYYTDLHDHDKTTGMDVLYRFYAGTFWGNLFYCAEPTYYTYTQTDNKIFVSNGDIFTITSDGLIQDGSSTILEKYNPTIVNRIASNDYWGTFEGTWIYDWKYSDGYAYSRDTYILNSDGTGEYVEYDYQEVDEDEYYSSWGVSGYIKQSYANRKIYYYYYLAKEVRRSKITYYRDKSITDGNDYVIKVGDDILQIVYLSSDMLGLVAQNGQIVGFKKSQF